MLKVIKDILEEDKLLSKLARKQDNVTDVIWMSLLLTLTIFFHIRLVT